MAIMQITLIPLGTGDPSVGQHIVEPIKILSQYDVNYKLGDMGTVVEGSIDQLIEVASKLHKSCFSERVSRVVTHITIDERKDKYVNLGDKVEMIQKELLHR